MGTHTSLPAPRAQFGIASSLSTNQIYVMGGIDGTGSDQTTILELTTGANPASLGTPGPPGTPSGVWATRGNPMLGVLLCAAMIINMFVAATAGTLVPLGLRAVNVDPALASSVFITTMTDVFGFASFLGLATLFVRYLGNPG